VGQALSALGISVSSFAYPLVVLEATGSPVKAGLIGSVLAGTAFVLRLPAGMLVDRWNRKRIMVLCEAGRALTVGTVAVALATGHFFLFQLLIVAFLDSALGVLFGPAESAAVRLVVSPDQIGEAVARNASRGDVAGLIGPPLGGVLFSAGRALPFFADALSYVVSLVGILTLRTPLAAPEPDHPRGGVRTELLAGARWIWSRPFLRALLVWFIGLGLVFNALGLITLVLARNHGASASQLGVMFSITAAGALAGGLATPWLLRHVRPYGLILAVAWVAVASTFLLLVADTAYAIGALGAAAFFFVPALNTLAFTLVAEDAPDHLQGRATAAGIQFASLAAPVGPILAGTLLESFGARHTTMIYGSILALLAAVGTSSRRLRGSDAL
jgi:predicted MFS family arabinose efflux permease